MARLPLAPAADPGPGELRLPGAGMSEFTGLSCYTANLLAYLAAVDDTAVDRFAESVRLAVRLDEPAFSHHRTPLDVLPDGSVLRYASGGEETAEALRAEIALHGRVIVVADNARLPWSPSFGTAATAPHWVLLDGCAGDEWHVVDHFAGLLPTGEQRPFEGVMSTSALMHAMDGPERLSPMQVRRNALAFGHPVEVRAVVGRGFGGSGGRPPAPGSILALGYDSSWASARRCRSWRSGSGGIRWGLPSFWTTCGRLRGTTCSGIGGSGTTGPPTPGGSCRGRCGSPWTPLGAAGPGTRWWT
nr:hypothetical protein GCM10017745_36290 [Saccharothrix mutabilis subsp. capreolus]